MIFKRASLEERLARKTAEYKEIGELMKRMESYPSRFVDKRISLSGDIAVLEAKIKAHRCADASALWGE